MDFGPERLDVCRAVIECLGRAFRLCKGMKSRRNAKGFDSDTDADSEGKPLI